MGKQLIEFPYQEDNGQITSLYYDLESGDVIESLEDLELEGLDPDDLPDLEILDGKTGESKGNPYKETPKLEKKLPGEGNDQKVTNTPDDPRTIGNNYGYVNTPTALSAATMAPGPIGMAAKTMDLAIAHNNAVATNAGRREAGLQDRNIGREMLSNMGFADTKGHVANVDINNRNYAVSLEAMDKGRTALTPAEARQRGALLGGITELDKKAAKEDNKAAQKEIRESLKSEPQTVDPSLVSPEPMTAPVGAVEKLDISRNAFDLASPAQTASAQTGPAMTGNSVRGGLGLGDISPTFQDRVENGVNFRGPEQNPGIDYSHPERGTVDYGLNERTRDTMNALGTNTPGGINVSSAYRDPQVNASVGGASKSLHSTGQAFDVSTKGMTDAEKRDLVERGIMSGAMELGTYTKDQSLHFASTQRVSPLDEKEAAKYGIDVSKHGGVTAMTDRSRLNYNSAPDWFKAGVEESRLAPTPTPRPDTIPGVGVMAARPVDIEKMTPDRPMAAGVQWSDKDKELSAKTLAGEIDLSKTNLSTEEGRREAYGIMSTIENRAAALNGNIQGAITSPNQYSTWNNTSAAKTANNNYNLNKDMYNKLVDDYVGNPQNNMGFTSYHANYVNPEWSGAMQGRTNIGPHTFGSLPEYQAPSKEMGTMTPTMPDFAQFGPEPHTAFSPDTPTQAIAGDGFMETMAATTAPTDNTPTDTTHSTESATGGQSSASGSSNEGGDSSNETHSPSVDDEDSGF